MAVIVLYLFLTVPLLVCSIDCGIFWSSSLTFGHVELYSGAVRAACEYKLMEGAGPGRCKFLFVCLRPSTIFQFYRDGKWFSRLIIA